MILPGAIAAATGVRQTRIDPNLATADESMSEVLHFLHVGQINSDLRKSLSSEKFRKIKNNLLFQKCEHWHIYRHPVPTRGALAIVTTWDGDAVDAEAATDERG
jgi:hypothetical protein